MITIKMLTTKRDKKMTQCRKIPTYWNIQLSIYSSISMYMKYDLVLYISIFLLGFIEYVIFKNYIKSEIMGVWRLKNVKSEKFKG